MLFQSAMGYGPPPALPDTPGKRPYCQAIFTRQYKFGRYFAAIDGQDYKVPRTVEELLATNDLVLYDVVEDPNELRNLAVTPEAVRGPRKELIPSFWVGHHDLEGNS